MYRQLLNYSVDYVLPYQGLHINVTRLRRLHLNNLPGLSWPCILFDRVTQYISFKMNDLQQKAIQLAGLGHSFGLSGSAGTGKTYTICNIVNLLVENFGHCRCSLTHDEKRHLLH